MTKCEMPNWIFDFKMVDKVCLGMIGMCDHGSGRVMKAHVAGMNATGVGRRRVGCGVGGRRSMGGFGGIGRGMAMGAGRTSLHGIEGITLHSAGAS